MFPDALVKISSRIC